VVTLPHPSTHFTQGLAFRESDGALCEGTGGTSAIYVYGASAQDNMPTAPLLSAALAASDFGEGVTSYLGKLYQLTWKTRRVHVYDARTLERVATLRQPDVLREGWGFAVSPSMDALVMSEGSAWLFWTRPNAAGGFDVTHSVVARDCGRGGAPVPGINEMELVPLNLTHPELVAAARDCDAPPPAYGMRSSSEPPPPGALLWGNVYGTQCVACVHPATGSVMAYVHLDGLNPRSTGHTQVTNGVAYRLSDGARVWVTGKNWKHLFQIELVELAAPPKDFPAKCATAWEAGRGVQPATAYGAENNLCPPAGNSSAGPAVP